MESPFVFVYLSCLWISVHFEKLLASISYFCLLFRTFAFLLETNPCLYSFPPAFVTINCSLFCLLLPSILKPTLPYFANSTCFLAFLFETHAAFCRQLHQLFRINYTTRLRCYPLPNHKLMNYSWMHTPSVVVVTDTQAYYY